MKRKDRSRKTEEHSQIISILVGNCFEYN